MIFPQHKNKLQELTRPVSRCVIDFQHLNNKFSWNYQIPFSATNFSPIDSHFHITWAATEKSLVIHTSSFLFSHSARTICNFWTQCNNNILSSFPSLSFRKEKSIPSISTPMSLKYSLEEPNTTQDSNYEKNMYLNLTFLQNYSD